MHMICAKNMNYNPTAAGLRCKCIAIALQQCNEIWTVARILVDPRDVCPKDKLFPTFFYFRQNKLVVTLPSLFYILNPDNLSCHVPLTYEPNPDLVMYYTNRGVRSGARFTRTCTQAAAARRKSSSSVS